MSIPAHHRTDTPDFQPSKKQREKQQKEKKKEKEKQQEKEKEKEKTEAGRQRLAPRWGSC